MLNMNTKLLMTVSALVMGITGIILSFLPHEVLVTLTLRLQFPIL